VVGNSEYTELTSNGLTIDGVATSSEIVLADLPNWGAGEYRDIIVEIRGKTDRAGATAVDLYTNGDTTDANYAAQEAGAGNAKLRRFEYDSPRIGLFAGNGSNMRSYHRVVFRDFKSTDISREYRSEYTCRGDSADLDRQYNSTYQVNHLTQTAALTSITLATNLGDDFDNTEVFIWGFNPGNKGGGVIIDSPKHHPTVSTTGTANEIQVSAGQLSSDDFDDQGMIRLNTAMTGLLNATWVKGAGNGKVHGGAAANGSVYRFYLALLDDGGVDWIAAEKTVTASTIKSSNSISRLAWTGVEREYDSGDILDFNHYPKTRTVLFDESTVEEYNTLPPPTVFALIAVTCPPECVFLGRFSIASDDVNDSIQALHGDKSTESGVMVGRMNNNGVSEYYDWEIQTDSQSRIKHRLSGTGTVSHYRIMRRGYKY